MSDPPYIIRNYCLEELNTLVQFVNEAEKLEERFTCTTLQDLLESLGLPNHFPEDNLFIAERAGEVIGYIDVIPELNIGRAVLMCIVYPENSRLNLFKSLIESALHRCEELQLNVAHVNIPQENRRAKRFFSKMGFSFIRRYLELRLDLSKAHLPNLGNTTLTVRSLRKGEEETLTQIQNRSFANTWGYNPNASKDIIYRISLPHCSLDDIIMAFEVDKPIGYCWTRMNYREDNAEEGGQGRVYMLGVDPDYRGKGVGMYLLAGGLSYLKSRGVRIVHLTVDSKNKAARALYRTVGFEAWKSSVWYEKVLGNPL
jgi:mycothiol synthase